MTYQELKTCPFCGHIPDLSLRVYDTASSKTYGFSCCIEMETDTTDRDAAIAMWNTRANPAPFGYVINEFGDSVPAASAEEAAQGVRRSGDALLPERVEAAHESDGDAFNVADPDLNMLLNLSADMVLGEANQDTAMLWMEYLKRVDARLMPVDDRVDGDEPAHSPAESFLDHEKSDTERMVHTLRSEPSPEAAVFYASLGKQPDEGK